VAPRFIAFVTSLLGGAERQIFDQASFPFSLPLSKLPSVDYLSVYTAVYSSMFTACMYCLPNKKRRYILILNGLESVSSKLVTETKFQMRTKSKLIFADIITVDYVVYVSAVLVLISKSRDKQVRFIGHDKVTHE